MECKKLAENYILSKNTVYSLRYVIGIIVSILVYIHGEGINKNKSYLLIFLYFLFVFYVFYSASQSV